ncbi:hypothetical protein ACF1AE_30265 [Streptomyces sp. NPDC014986]|uniref:hypothetical protein n=1 Tax=Streptomyces sp. NPDC014986 TaxID=3364934 RepID=UPI0036FF6510
MSEQSEPRSTARGTARSKGRHRRAGRLLAAGLPLALTTTGLLVHGADPGPAAPRTASAATAAATAAAAPAWATATADGFASVNALGQNGTYGGRDGAIVTVRTRADLEKYATRFAEYRNTGAGAGPASGDRPHLTDAQAADQEITDWLAGWTPTAS